MSMDWDVKTCEQNANDSEGLRVKVGDIPNESYHGIEATGARPCER